MVDLMMNITPRCEKCGAWLHETEQKHGCIMCQSEVAK